MGVPSFYRWLARKYPKIVVDAVEKSLDDEKNTCLPNLNSIEFDNLYLDMNGIIHPCFHPENDEERFFLSTFMHENSPLTYDQVFKNVFECIDSIVRPRKLIYMAIDGVAPRAKMNQQRTRRFRNAQDHETLRKEEHRLRRQYEVEGRDVLPSEDSELSDSNVITPGTQFMCELSKQLQSYICLRIAGNPAWKQLKVILSDSNAPGEGEHKIMSFIRSQRTSPGYNPDTSHVLYGLDADLIMLALATHEIHFSILRENVFAEDKPQVTKASVSFLAETSEVECDRDRELKDTVEKMSNLEISSVRKPKSLVKKPYQFLHIWILRQYLNLDLGTMNLPKKFELDVERLIDDLIFICFFAGNDFLPHMPTLEMHEGAMDLLLHVYKEEFKNLGGHLIDVQKVNDKKESYIKFKRVEKFILAVGAYEDKIFKKRSTIRDSILRRILSDNHDTGDDVEEELFPVISTFNKKESATCSNAAFPCSSSSHEHDVQIVENTKMLKEQLKTYTRKTSDVFKNGLVTDMVKFGSPGWRKRYYEKKFGAETDVDVEKMRKKVVEKYTEGLCWVLLYYFSGVPSWTWFFPYHYGPFASDMKGLSSTKVVFQKGLPFKPFDQLMAVLPPMSAHALPASYQSLMTDQESMIIDFYPDDFEIDTDGKRFLWQGICKLPFINEEYLLSATKKIEKEINEEEAKRNGVNVDFLFVHSSESFASRIISTFNDKGVIDQNTSVKIDTGLSGEIKGFVLPKPESKKDHDSSGLANDVDVLCVYFDSPCLSVNIPRLLEGTTIPETVVTESDVDVTQLWHENQGYSSRNRYSQIRGATRGSSVGFRPSCPGVAVRGAENGWSPKGRGKFNHCLDYQSDPRNYAHGRGGANGNQNSGYYQPRSTGGSADYPTRANNTNGHVMFVKTDSGSSTYGRANDLCGARGNRNSGYYRPTWTGSHDGHVMSVKTDSGPSTYGHANGLDGARGNRNTGYYRPTWTGSADGHVWSVKTDLDSSTNGHAYVRGGANGFGNRGYYPPRWTSRPASGNVRSANESGSSGNQTMWQRGGARPRNAPRDNNNGRW